MDLNNFVHNFTTINDVVQSIKTKHDIKNFLPIVGKIIYSSDSKYLEKEIIIKNYFSYSSSSEHLVIMAYMYDKNNLTQEGLKIALKFKLIDNGFVMLIEKHIKTIGENYRMLTIYLNNYFSINKKRKILINDVFYVFSDKGIYWCEKYLNNFRKFWDFGFNDHIDKLVNTDHVHLKNFQKYIYDFSKNKHTIVDLQGTIDDDFNYILTDIEYTDTLEKFKLKQNDLLNSFIKYQNKIVNKKPIDYFGIIAGTMLISFGVFAIFKPS